MCRAGNYGWNAGVTALNSFECLGVEPINKAIVRRLDQVGRNISLTATIRTHARIASLRNVTGSVHSWDKKHQYRQFDENFLFHIDGGSSPRTPIRAAALEHVLSWRFTLPCWSLCCAVATTRAGCFSTGPNSTSLISRTSMHR